eukprot:RCo041260
MYEEGEEVAVGAEHRTFLCAAVAPEALRLSQAVPCPATERFCQLVSGVRRRDHYEVLQSRHLSQCMLLDDALVARRPRPCCSNSSSTTTSSTSSAEPCGLELPPAVLGLVTRCPFLRQQFSPFFVEPGSLSVLLAPYASTEVLAVALTEDFASLALLRLCCRDLSRSAAQEIPLTGEEATAPCPFFSATERLRAILVKDEAVCRWQPASNPGRLKWWSSRETHNASLASLLHG